MTPNSSKCTPSQPRPIHAILVVTTIDGAPATVALDYGLLAGSKLFSTANMGMGFGPLMVIHPTYQMRFCGAVEHIHNSIENLLQTARNIIRADDGGAIPPVVAITEQEANLLRLLRSCRTANRSDMRHPNQDGLTRAVVELLDGCTVEFAQAVLSEAESLICRTAVFTTTKD